MASYGFSPTMAPYGLPPVEVHVTERLSSGQGQGHGNGNGNWHDPAYVSESEETNTRASGPKILTLLLEISRPCRSAENGARKRVRCLASKDCRATWAWPRNRSRILEHAAGCDFLPPDLKQRASEELSYMKAKQKALKDPRNHSVKRPRNAEMDDSGDTLTARKRARELPVGVANPSFGSRIFPVESSTVHDRESWSQDIRITTLPPRNLPSSMMRSQDAPGSNRAAENPLDAANRFPFELSERIGSTYSILQTVGPSVTPLSETQGSRSMLFSKPRSIMDMPERGYGMEIALEMTVKIAGFSPVIDGIRTILALIDGTRYSTWVRAAESVLDCLPAYRDLATDRFPVRDYYKLKLWMRKHCWPSSPRFEAELQTFLAVALPYAISIGRFTSTQTTPQDVVKSWLEVQEEIYQALNDEELVWPDMATKEEVHNILSHEHFTELFYDYRADGSTIDMYLDPKLRDVRMYRPVFFNYHNEFGRMADKFLEEPTARLRLPTLARWRTETKLLSILHRDHLYDFTSNNSHDIMKDRNPLLSSLAADVARQQLRAELKAFARGDRPFNRRYNFREGEMRWWLHVQKEDGARVLGALAILWYYPVDGDITASSESEDEESTV
ncbi:hypothetical protein WOLCODRAFT_166098 [Wolfiporia cocos MD-104 SS10]|uniref:Uncharacterized protein n=1 Tax=Wolfiporia cocos (strain MD-104) TaxID=742152 RepID=A0A2H3JGQ0_WOLCO|nr:hypothetical protein WOLCODRAFT_166098 [Wolfiporia cocos MD-104 SS10]